MLCVTLLTGRFVRRRVAGHPVHRANIFQGVKRKKSKSAARQADSLKDFGNRLRSLFFSAVLYCEKSLLIKKSNIPFSLHPPLTSGRTLNMQYLKTQQDF